MQPCQTTLVMKDERPEEAFESMPADRRVRAAGRSSQQSPGHKGWTTPTGPRFDVSLR